MTHDAFLLVKLDHPHGSIERARKHSGGNGSSSGAGRVSFLLLSLSCLLWQMGNMSAREVESRGVRGKEKTTGLKRGQTKQF
jgi:hypothetical protein